MLVGWPRFRLIVLRQRAVSEGSAGALTVAAHFAPPEQENGARQSATIAFLRAGEVEVEGHVGFLERHVVVDVALDQVRIAHNTDAVGVADARDDRPWGGSGPPGVAYLYAPDRKAEQTIRHLQGFVGTLQVDGYAGYKVLAERNAVSLAFCWSHVWRKFYELAQSGPAPIAMEALARIAALYEVEAGIRGRPAEERHAARQASSRPTVAALEPLLSEKLGLVSQKSKLAEAIRYALSRWQGLSRFLDDGQAEPDRRTSPLELCGDITRAQRPQLTDMFVQSRP